MKKDNPVLLCKSAIRYNMASRGDNATPQLKLSQFWHTTFDDIFKVFNPDEWTLEPTDKEMPRVGENLGIKPKSNFSVIAITRGLQ